MLKQIALALVLCPVFLMAQSDDDVATATIYARKFKEDGIMCLSSYQSYTFGKGQNSLNDNVVTIEEQSQYDFISLKKFSSMVFPEYYNKFIKLENFRRSVKYREKFQVAAKSGIDQSVTDDGIFFDDSRVQYFPVRFDQKGNMSRIEVKKLYQDGKYLTRLFFNASYPIKEQVIEFKVPDWLTVDFKKMNFEGAKIETNEVKKGGFTTYSFKMREVPGIKREDHSIGVAYTDPHIIIQIRSFDNKGETLKGFDKVDDVYAWNNRLYKMAGNDPSKLRDQVNKITAGKAKDEDKIKAIYYWVQDNIRYLAYEDGYSGYIPASAQDVLDKKYGDCKGMANLLTEMLQIAGYDAHFSWIGTRHIPYAQNTPALCVNNHAICTLYYGGKVYFLDGTENYVPFGENAFRIQGKEVMIANGDKFDIKPVPATLADESVISTKAEFTMDKDNLKGKVKLLLTGNQRTQFHQVYQELPVSGQQDYLKEMLQFNNDNLVATNVKTSDLKNRELPVSVEGDVQFANAVSTISGDQYVGIDFFPKTMQRFVPDEKRVRGYDLDEVLKFDDQISLTAPAGRKFIDLPEALHMKFDGYEFHGEYKAVGNKITLTKTLLIKNSFVQKSDFANWTKFLESIRQFNDYLLTISH